jgi:hypothetical protein
MFITGKIPGDVQRLCRMSDFSLRSLAPIKCSSTSHLLHRLPADCVRTEFYKCLNSTFLESQAWLWVAGQLQTFGDSNATDVRCTLIPVPQRPALTGQQESQWTMGSSPTLTQPAQTQTVRPGLPSALCVINSSASSVVEEQLLWLPSSMPC